MYTSTRHCPKCNSQIIHTTIRSQQHADYLATNSANKLCRSCIATNVNNRRWLSVDALKKQSDRWKKNNPNKGVPWNKGLSHTEETKQKIKKAINANGSRSGTNNSNYGKFKQHNTDKSYKIYHNRVRVLTERVKHSIPGYSDELRAKVGIEGGYQIDHIKSILECWYDKWTPEQAADISNLQFIKWEDNLKKRKWKSKQQIK